MSMKKEVINTGTKSCISYVHTEPQYILLQPVDEHDIELLDTEVTDICSGSSVPFVLTAVKIDDWNVELSPWEAPAVFGKEGFGHGAEQTLDCLRHEVLPSIRNKYFPGDDVPVILGGYSLAGLFSLWSGYQTNCFSAVMAASPSVWFNGWTEYAEAHAPKTNAVYLSLGDKEEKTRNKTMAKVGEAIRTQKALLAEQGVKSTLEWNRGNHFQDSDHRCAQGFIWCIEQLPLCSQEELHPGSQEELPPRSQEQLHPRSVLD